MGYDMDIYARRRLSLWVMSGMYWLIVVVQVEVCWMWMGCIKGIGYN